MFRRCVVRPMQTHLPAGHFAMRTRSTRIQDRQMRAPLLTERPYPLSEIVRRMVRIRCKFEDSEDFNERSLLRGEYKYYSGKTAEVRDADTADMVALIDCYAFFGFWDNKLLTIVNSKLLERTSQMDTLELLLLFKGLSALEQTASDLYLDVCDRLAEMAAEQLSVEETVSLVSSAVRHTPQKLLRTAIFGRIMPQLEFIDAVEHASQILDGLTKLAPLPEYHDEKQSEQEVRRAGRHLLRALSEVASQVHVREIAVSLHAAAVLGILDDQVEREVRDLTTAFVQRAKQADPGALALVLEALASVDSTLILNLNEVIVRQLPHMAPSQSVVCLEAIVELVNIVDAMDTAERRRAPGVDDILTLLGEVVRGHSEAMKSAAHPRTVEVLLRTLSCLARIDLAHRPSVTAFHPCCQSVYSAAMAISPRFSARDCSRFLEVCVSLRAAVSDTATKAVLDRVMELATVLPPTEAAALLRDLHALPPLATSAARAMMQHQVLPAVLKRADGPPSSS